jgi:Putative restriction endonuclease
MSTVAPAPISAPFAPAPHPDVLVDNKVVIPGWVCDHDSYRRWARSENYPASGWVSYLDGVIAVDLNMEEIFTHNQVKQAFNVAIGMILLQNSTGRFFPDRLLYSNKAAGLTTESDGLYAHWATLQSGRLRFVPGKTAGFVEAEGTADVALEDVSQSSETKDTVKLRALYEKARIPEYWLVDARVEPVTFVILRLVDDVYQDVLAEDGWLKSEVFGRSFQLVRKIDPLGQPHFFVNVKP